METSEIRRIERTSHTSLVNEVYGWAREHGHEWILGGPSAWGKRELVSAVIAIREGREP